VLTYLSLAAYGMEVLFLINWLILVAAVVGGERPPNPIFLKYACGYMGYVSILLDDARICFNH
jgi:hypothetical protein